MEDSIASVMAVTCCSREAAAAAVEAAGEGGLELAIDLVLSSTSPEVAAPAPPPAHKMVAIVRQDLGMGVGKVAAQVSHATLGAYKLTLRRPGGAETLAAWEAGGEPTIVLQVDSLQQLDELMRQAETRGLVTCRIADAGRTEVAAGTVTVGAIGPAAVTAIDEVTGRLSLLV